MSLTWERIEPKRMREDEDRDGALDAWGSARALFAAAVSRHRAVIFNSDLFHETDRFTFRSGYLNRRVTITMLHGSRHGAGEG